MKHSSVSIIGAGLLLAASVVAGAFADDAPTGSKQGIGKGPAVQQSVPSPAPTPTPTKQTGATNQSAPVKAMNKEAKQRVETEGK